MKLVNVAVEKARLRSQGSLGSRGVSLIEVMVASTLLIIVFYGVASYYTNGRRQLDFEEDRRVATSVIQARLDGLRHDYVYDDLINVNGVDTTYTVANRTFTVSHLITPDAPEAQASRVAITVAWNAKLGGGGNVSRSMSATTLMARKLP